GVPYTPEGETATASPSASPESTSAPESAATAPSPVEAAKTLPTAASAPAPSTSSAGPAETDRPQDLVVPADFALEGTMSISQVAKDLKASEEAVIAKLGLPAAIERDKPLRDMKDQYGYTMPELKERLAK
ncbi:MAG TPA: hypothetical protein VMV44_02410, partial [Rectinemataceae bacterium]|nr:hypothetical protein [Rectinemataceae bacterium]